jgi:hypothetical protein
MEDGTMTDNFEVVGMMEKYEKEGEPFWLTFDSDGGPVHHNVLVRPQATILLAGMKEE